MPIHVFPFYVMYHLRTVTAMVNLAIENIAYKALLSQDLTAIAFCDQCCGIPFSDWHGQGLGLKPLFLPFCVVIQILLHRYYRTSIRSKMK